MHCGISTHFSNDNQLIVYDDAYLFPPGKPIRLLRIKINNFICVLLTTSRTEEVKK